MTRVHVRDLILSVTAVVAAVATPLAAQTKPGTAKGFVRVNGDPRTLSHSYGVTAPDSFDPSKAVRLVLVTATPIPAGALEKAADRNAIFQLVAEGAIVEIRETGHSVFIRHKALGGQQLNTGGESSFTPVVRGRISGDVRPFMSGDQDSFGYKVRYEIAFDAPMLRSLALGKSAAAPATPAPAQPPAARPTAGPAPKTRAEAEKYLANLKVGTGPSGLAFYLTLGNTISADVVRAYLLVGARADRPTAIGDYPLSLLAVGCEGKAGAGEAAEVLLSAGADPNRAEPSGRKASPAMAAVICPDVLRAILARKPDLNVVDANDLTAMHYALMFGKPKDVTARMLRDAGFDLTRWRAALTDHFSAGSEARKILDALLAPPARGR
jgi:hypothetical protein